MESKYKMMKVSFRHEEAQECGPCCAMCGDYDMAMADCIGTRGRKFWLRVTIEAGLGTIYQVGRGDRDSPPNQEYLDPEEMSKSRYAEGLRSLERLLVEEIVERRSRGKSKV